MHSTNPAIRTVANAEARELLRKHQLESCKQTDRMFAYLMSLQWLAAIAVTLWLSPTTWNGPYSRTHLQVWLAFLLGGAISVVPVMLALTKPGRPSTRYTIAVGQMLMGALLIHLSGGRIETHFHVFGSLAFLAFYRDWRVLVPATVVVAADHFLRGAFWPESVYGVLTVNHWRWVEHAGWVAFEDFFLVLACVKAQREMWQVARRTAQLDIANESLQVELGERARVEEALRQVQGELDQRVGERTSQLAAANAMLEGRNVERDRIEDALRESEERYRELFENAKDAIYVHNLKGVYLSCNRAAVKLSGYTQEEIIGRNFSEFLAPEFSQSIRSQMQQKLAEHGETVYEIEVVAKDGRRVPVEVSSRLIYENGIAIGVQGTGRDITERKRTEHERDVMSEVIQSVNLTSNLDELLKQVHASLKRLVYAENCCVILYDKQTDLFESPLFVDTVEQNPFPRALGNSCAAKVFRSRRPLLLNETSFAELRDSGEVELLGRPAPSFLAVPLITPAETIGVIAVQHYERDNVYTQRDVEFLSAVAAHLALAIERKRAEEAMVESEQRFRDLFENASDVIYTADFNGKFTSLNKSGERMTGYSREEAAHLNFSDVVAPETMSLVREMVQRKLRGNTETVYELEMFRKDGEPLQMEVSSRAIFKHGKPIGIQGIGRDISQRKQVETELKRARDAAIESSRVKSEFLANMSHEIRTPMNAILGMTELTLDTELNAEQREYLGIVKSSTHSLLTIINDILDFSKIEAGKLALDTIDFSLQEALSATTRTVALEAHEKGLELAFAASEDVPDCLLGDPGRLQQVVLNLLGNAVKFTAAGEIVVRVERESSIDNEVVLHFSVADTGIGIPVDKQKVIFAAFAQADGSTTRRYGGTGLGLAISSQLVEMMGGRIWVESKENKGSTFHFTARFGLQTERPARTSLPPAQLRGGRALIVDDNSANRRILIELLTRWQMKPVAVESGRQAIAALESARRTGQEFSLVLLDTCMPDMDGFSVAEQIRDSEAGAGTTIMMLTSLDQQLSMSRIRALGITSYLVKPISQSDLFNAIHSVLGTSEEDETVAVAPEIALKLPGRSLHFLLAEDNEVNQKLAVWILQKRGHTLTVVPNGKRAVEALAQEKFDAVLMDVQMPEMNGFEATALIRQREKINGGHLPIIAMTALAMKGDRERCLAAGMDEYIAKPIQADQIFQAVERLVAPGAAANATAAGPAFDEGHLQSMVEGSRELRDQLTEIFAEEWPPLLAALRTAIGDADAKAVRQLAHKVRGSAGIFGATAVIDSALRLENIGLENNLGVAGEELTQLDRELHRLQKALDELALQPV
jgi:PAS domain S-box-containing protein